jgi:hypothetical protein
MNPSFLPGASANSCLCKAVEGSPVVFGWENGGRGVVEEEPQRYTAVHRSIDGVGVGSDRYVLIPGPLITVTNAPTMEISVSP